MSGGVKSAHAEAFAFGVTRCRSALLAGTALVAVPAFLALSFRAAQADDLVNDGTTYTVQDHLRVDDVTNQNGGVIKIKKKSRLRADGTLTNDESSKIVNEGQLRAVELYNGDETVNKDNKIVNKGKLTVDDVLYNTGDIVNKRTGKLTVGTSLTNIGTIRNDGQLGTGELTNFGRIRNDGKLTVGDTLTNWKGGEIVNKDELTVEEKYDLINKKGGKIVNKGKLTVGNDLINSGTIVNKGKLLVVDTLTNNSSGLIVNNGTVTDALINSGVVMNNGTYNANVSNSGSILNSGTWTGNLDSNTGVVTLANGSSWTGSLTNDLAGTINLGTSSVLATNQLVTGDVSNAGLINVFGIPTVSGNVTNSGTIDLTGGPTPTANRLTTGSFTGLTGSAINISDDLSAIAGKSGELISANGNSGSTTINFSRLGGPVVLGGPTQVIVNNGAPGSGTLNATATGNGVGAFGLVNVSLQSVGNGNWDLVRSLNTGATTAPVASIMAALAAIDTSFHQSTTPFVASPQSQDPDKWTGGVWSRATGGQTTTKSMAFESFGGTSADLRVKTNFDAYEVGVDTGILNFNGSGWNGHFGVMAGAVNATADELLSGSGTSIKFDVPFAGVYGVMTHGPFFMDLEFRHDWVDTHVTNVPANLTNADLKGHGDSLSGSAGYHFDLVNNWFVEPAAGFGLTQTQFDSLATNLGQQSQGIAPGTITFDSIFSMLVHGGARVGTSFIVADTLALQPFGTLSVWRELGGQSNATFANGGVTDPLTLSRVGTFYQVGVGLSAQVLNTGLIGFVRGDFRWGDDLNGAAVVGGLRYTFAP
jgi:hypothetical protein